MFGATDISITELKPYEFMEDGKSFAVFSHCWIVMSEIMKNKSKEIYVEDEPYEKYIKKIEEYRNKNSNTTIIVYLHWNFDFEKLPFPSHRIIAKRLIDVGADVIIGSHSHLVNGGEIYKNKPIIYGLGNFYIPDGKFLDKTLIYPEESSVSMIFEIDTSKEKYTSYWIKNEKKSGKIKLLQTEDFEEGELINKYSPYRKMNEKEYIKYFKKNRVKKILVPIWYNEKDNLENKVKDTIVIIRMKIFRYIKKRINFLKVGDK